jgi:branched-chain amino acid transport system substrate-binding protein
MSVASRRFGLVGLAPLACAALASIAGCGNNSGGNTSGGTTTGTGNGAQTTGGSTGQGTAPAGDPIKIGHYASITGSEATFGVSTDNGIKLAVEEINAAGGVNGRPIELITYDNRGNATEVNTVVNRLITSDNVVAVLGEVASSRSLIGAPICQEFGVPMISPSSTNPQVTEVGDMIFRVCFLDEFQGDVCARFAHERGWTRGAVLYNRQQAYATGLKDFFVAPFTDLGGEIVTEQAYGDGDAEFGAQLTAIANSGAEFIFVPGYYTDVGTIAKQLRARGMTIPLLGGDGWDSAELANIAGDAINGCFYSNHYSHEEERPEVREFVERYQDEYGSVPDGLAALGYDAAMILFDAMERADSLEGEDIAAALADTEGFAGVTGSISIDDNRNASKSAVILEYREGQPRYVDRFEAE